MSTATATKTEHLHQIPARVLPADHEAMKRLAAHSGRKVGQEYRAAIAAWLARPSNSALLAEPQKAVA